MSRLIDADAAIWELTTGCFPQSMEYTRAVGIAKRLIQEMPTIEAEPVRHGRWVKRGQDIFCSECDEESGYTWAGASRYSDYCPSCGAKMDGGADNG